ncbi:MAG: hypothetical protein PF487_09410, partial [Bacteroidales bacterium]|nr:hypothetical protein [Bacteroidales bacterium]
KNYIIEIKSQIDVLIERLNNVKELSFFSFADVDKVIDKFIEYKIDITYFSHLNTRNTKKLIKFLNDSIDSVLHKAGILQGEINKHKKEIQETIQAYKDDIDEFLKFAGYKYKVYIELDDDEKYRMKLKHNDFVQPISEANYYLSFGERNAFSLILFMFDSIKRDVDLVILDDPISSFDKNKKFAILNRIFRGKKSFRDKTVLLLTHDFEPLIDIIYNLPHKFQPKPSVNFLKTENSIIHEIEILKSDIKLFHEIAIENIQILSDDINKLIYLRRLFELNIDKNESYHLISNIFHKRDQPLFITINDENNLELTQMGEDAILKASIEIQEYISSFDYFAILERVKDYSQMINLYNLASNNYEKLQIFRILFPNSDGNDVINKFINESYHIENDYLLQLNPCKYDLVPYYIIDLCDQNINQYLKNC